MDDCTSIAEKFHFPVLVVPLVPVCNGDATEQRLLRHFSAALNAPHHHPAHRHLTPSKTVRYKYQMSTSQIVDIVITATPILD